MIEYAFPRKIAFVGTSCTGKTTIFEHYKKQFAENHKVTFVEEAARIFFQNNPNIDDRFSTETQERIQAFALQNELYAHELGTEILLCDRSVIDAVAYVRANGDKKGSDRLLENVAFWLSTYHKFLLLDPAGVPYETDNVRQEDIDKRQQFHDAFISLFADKKIPYELLGGTLKERINRVDKILASDK